MASSGPLYAGTAADDSSVGSVAWSNPNNAKASNNSYASTGFITGTSTTHYLKLTNYGFALPSNATIDGIVVEIERNSQLSSWGAKDFRVSLVKSDGSISSTNKADTTTEYPTSDTIATYGGSSDLWGESWAYSDINDVDFGVVLQVQRNDSQAIPRVDFIRVTVYYHTASTVTVTHTTDVFKKDATTKTHTTDVFKVGWYDTDFKKRIQIKVDHTKVGADQTNIPVYVDLSNLAASDLFDYVQNGGGDIRITTDDGVTEVPREVVFCDTGTETGELHFKAPNLYTAVDTVFYVYFHNAGASEPAEDATYGRENVWTNGYRAVYHLHEAVNNTAGGYLDSTANDYDGTGSSMAMTAPDGKLAGKGQEFDGTADRIDISGQYGNQAILTLQAWAYSDVTSGRREILSLADQCVINQDGTNDQGFYDQDGGGWFTTGAATGVSGAWYMLHYVCNPGSSSQVLYRNGSSIDSDSETFPIQYNGGTSRIGSHGGGSSSFWNGKVDEVRISSVARSSTWISTEYNNQNSPSTFYSVRAIETIGATLTLSHTTDVHKKDATTKTHTTDVLNKKAATRDHTTDTFKKDATTKTHTSDTYLKDGRTVAHTTDVLAKAAAILAHTTDVYAQITQVLSHTTDTFLKDSTAISHTTDTHTKDGREVTHTTDTHLKAATEVSHTTDALILKSTEVSHTTDVYTPTAFAKEHTTDVFLKDASTLSHSSDTYLKDGRIVAHTTDVDTKKGIEVSHTTDALLKKAATVSHTTDVFKQDSSERSHSTDVLAKKSFTLDHTTDVFSKDATEVAHDTDVYLKDGREVSHTTDVDTKDALTAEHTTDVYLTRSFIKTHLTDVFTKDASTVDHSTDTFKKDASTLQHTSDVYLKDAIEQSHSTDVFKKDASTVAHTTDTHLKDGREASHTTDVFKKDSSTVQHTTDVLAQKTYELLHTTDVFAKDASTLEHTTDAFLKDASEVSHSTDTHTKDGREAVHTTDILLKDTRSVEHTTDTFKQDATEVSHTTDALLLKSFTVDHTTDVYTKDASELSHTTDVVCKEASTLSHTTDIYLALPVRVGVQEPIAQVIGEDGDAIATTYGEDSEGIQSSYGSDGEDRDRTEGSDGEERETVLSLGEPRSSVHSIP